MPAAMLGKLRAVQQRYFRACLEVGLYRGIAILLTAMLVAMAVDGLVVLFDHRLRWALTLWALSCAAIGMLLGGVMPLLRKRSLSSFARQIDTAHPSLEERFLSLAEFAESQDSPSIRGSEAMMRKIAQQADQLSSLVTPELVIPKAPVIRARKLFWVAAGVVLIAFLLDFSRVKILCERFWAPGADITLTKVHAKPGDILIGKGEAVTLEIATSGRRSDTANLLLRSTNGISEIVSLKRTGATSAFVYTKNAVANAFEYKARSGDGQTAWHRVTLADRPNLTQTRMRIIPPAYSHLPVMEKQDLPPHVRALAGSKLELTFQSDQPLASMTLRFSDNTIQALSESSHQLYSFNTLLTNSFTFTPVLKNLQRLENLVKTSCEMLVYPDEPPAVKILSPNEEITTRPDDIVKIDFEARDDFGIASAKLVVTIKTDTNSTSLEIPIPLKEESGTKRLRKQVELNLAQFHLKQDQELSYIVQVTDTKENLASGTPQQAAEQNASTAAQTDSEKKPSGSAKVEARTDSAATNNSVSAANAANNSTSATNAANDSASAAGSANNPASAANATNRSNLRPDLQTHLAMAAKPSQPGSRPPGDQPPPNDMSKRVLDAGQCSSCQPMRILVDEWGRSFEGQLREKLEIAIDPTLKLLDDLLGKSEEFTDATLAVAKSDQGLSQKQTPALENGRGNLRQADSVVTELKSKTQDTPYAFIGLQLDDIREAHISPARQALGSVALEPARKKEDREHLEQASFEIKRAREKLAALTRSYATVKRDYKLADAMQRLKKMHQIFLEDTQEMLGSGKPVLNPQQRKVAEVSDEFVEKYRKLLEEKKKIMAELAKILADDPRMLRRFLAIQQLEGTSLRDQMTLLAQRQQFLADNVAKWNVTDEKERPVLTRQFLSTQTAEQVEIAALAVKMQENMITWLPLDMSADTDLITDCRNLAADSSRLAAEASVSAETSAALEAAHKAMEKIRSLDGRLLQLDLSEGIGNSKVKFFAANRMTEVANLITSQSGWIKKMEALRKGDYPQAVEVDQHRLTLDTTLLSEKLDATSLQVRQLSPQIGAKADELNGTVHKEILPRQSDATDALSKRSVSDAARNQKVATEGFATGEKQFDELLRLIIAKIDEAPPPTDPGQAKSLEEMLAMLQDEQKALEGLGIPCRPLNISVQKDWLKPGSGSGQGRAQARSAQAQARLAAEKTQRVSDQAKKQAQSRASELSEGQAGPKRPARSWNTLVSQLGEELRQGRDSIPPEQYRQAIEHYFNTISEKMPVPEAAR